jgi:phosphoglycerol transferase MdoB-like AlkP superfamily enzyme
MKNIIVSLLRQLAFWILFFNLTRLVFFVYYLPVILVEKIRFTEIAGAFLYAFKLDLATACYLMILPFLILLVQSIWSPKWLNIVNKAYTIFILFAYSLTAAGEMGIYAEWKTKLTYKVIKYLSHPGEIYNSAETGTFFLLVVILLVLFTVGTISYLKFFYMNLVNIGRNLWFTLFFLVLTPPLLFIGLRGGVQQIPINQSESYYSDHNILNIAAVNNGFNLYISIFENLQNFDRNPYLFMPPAEAEAIMRKIYSVQADSTVKILKSDRPNIVLVILESWSADLIQSLGGEPGITPGFRELEKGGILFDQIYASGSRSEQGMASIFGGFPAHPISSITVQPDKFVKLPSFPKDLEKAGYSTSFYFGGQLIYGNIKSYIIFNGFNKIMEGKDFPGTIPQGKLGIHDEYTLAYMEKELGLMTQPFFASLFTVSTHSPWDQPYPKPLKWGDNEREYINAALYTDHCLVEFIAEAKKEPWYSNTLFVFVADHSHNSYRNWHPQSREYHKIPMLFYGEVIRDEFRGTRWPKLGNQHDIAATLLAQLNLPADNFRFSKNLFNPHSPEFAYYSTEDGVGWIRPWGYFTYDKGTGFYYDWTNPATADSIKQEGKAYLQTVFGQYMRD